MAPNVKNVNFWLFGEGGGGGSEPDWPINNETGPIKIGKQSDKDFLSYRENNEVSADAA